MNKSIKYVGLDVHRDSISVAVADGGGGAARFVGDIAPTRESLSGLVKRLGAKSTQLSFCYEAGPCGYDVHRTLTDWGHACAVVAPSLIPRKPGERVKTDHRDCVSLARLHRAGELTAVWVPDEEQEAMRDLTRARTDAKHVERQARQRLNAFVLRHGYAYSGKTRWTQAHYRWLETLRFAHPVQQVVFQGYVDETRHAREQVLVLEQQMRQALAQWPLAPLVEALMAMRGINLVTALSVVAELGDITRFDSPRQLMAYLGLVPSEHSSGARTRRGGITKSGNSHVRRLLVESAWCYRFAAKKSYLLQRRAEKTSAKVQAIAWKAQLRLCARYRYLVHRGKKTVQACTAVARELVGFIWAIACEVMGRTVQVAR